MAEKELTVNPTAYRRKIVARPVTFECVCHPGGPTTITEDRFPGPTPKACQSCHDNGRYREWRTKEDWKVRKAKKAEDNN